MFVGIDFSCGYNASVMMSVFDGRAVRFDIIGNPSDNTLTFASPDGSVTGFIRATDVEDCFDLLFVKSDDFASDIRVLIPVDIKISTGDRVPLMFDRTNNTFGYEG